MAARDGRTPLILGHRGYSARFPENTLLAFREAMVRGADGIELDVQKTADGRYIVIHDPTTDRVSGSPGSVGAMTLGQIRQVDVGRGERVPTLEEVLDGLPRGAYVDVELKHETLDIRDCGPIAEILDARVPRRRLMISSFKPRLLRPLRALGFTVGLLLGEEALALGAGRLLVTLLVLRPAFLNLPVQIIELFGPHKVAVLLHAFRVLGFSILFWTVNDEAGARAVAGPAAILVSDEVERMVELRRQGF